MNKRLIGLLAVLVLVVVFAGSQAGLASVTSITDQIKSLQLKVIKEKIKELEKKILDVGREKPQVATPTKEELARQLETQIKALEDLIAQLKPRVIEEESARIDKRIGEINVEMATADNARLRELASELDTLVSDQEKIEEQVRKALEDALIQKQIAAIQEQVRVLQIKVRTLPTNPSKEKPSNEAYARELKSLINQAQLKLIKAQATAVQEKIDEIKSK